MFDVDLSNFNPDIIDALSEGAGITPENPMHDVLISEQIILENLSNEELMGLMEDAYAIGMLEDENILNERTIVRFDKKAKFSRAEAQAILAIAREKNDRDFKKLVTIWKMRKLILNKLSKKYGVEAKRRAKKNMKKMSSSNSSVIKKVVAKATNNAAKK